MVWITRIATALTAIGGINWGLVGAFSFNLVDAIFGERSVVSRIVYVLVGTSALVTLATLVRPNPDVARIDE
ncbi:putative membrane protein YuzA [Pseudoclavibacter endophyticus]|uniref:DUF378 domain-containing protein n=1 Tax=Pseudoclavibacter endophyticus TaxID=1778590 RepID=UPI0019BA6ED5|nr:DUF378 domain-containing protein [Pseudoclavibacter endophyticus]GGA63048.1 putative membrane protein YuzA [Pseudoclavibacter endophyticus]